MKRKSSRETVLAIRASTSKVLLDPWELLHWNSTVGSFQSDASDSFTRPELLTGFVGTEDFCFFQQITFQSTLPGHIGCLDV